MPHYRIALIGGDGIGPEVVQEAARVLKAAEGGDLHFSFEEAEGLRLVHPHALMPGPRGSIGAGCLCAGLSSSGLCL